MGMGKAAAKGLALAGVLLAVSAGSASAHQAIFGYNDHALYANPTKVKALAQATGARAYRMTLEWHGIEPRGGTWYWGEFDERYRQILAAGMRPVMMLRSAPAWAAQDAFSNCVSAILAGDCVRPPAPAFLGAWAEFARRAAERYPQALGFEIWNEPNHPVEWTPRVDPVYYVRVLRAAYDAIKAERPKAIVVSGGITPLSTTRVPGSVTPENFLRIFYAAGGRGAMDAIGIHPYGYPLTPLGSNSLYNQVMKKLRIERDLAGDTKTPFWITEFGYHTGPSIGGVSRDEQAEFLSQAVPQVLKEPDIDVALLHSLADWDANTSIPGYAFGLLTSNLNAKPALAAVERVVPPELQVLSAPKSIRSSCAKPKKKPKSKKARTAAKCKVGGTVKAQIWKDAKVTVSLTARRRKTFRTTRQLYVGSSVLKISARIARKPMKPGSYNLRVVAVDKYGNRSDVVQRKIRIR